MNVNIFISIFQSGNIVAFEDHLLNGCVDEKVFEVKDATYGNETGNGEITTTALVDFHRQQQRKFAFGHSSKRIFLVQGAEYQVSNVELVQLGCMEDKWDFEYQQMLTEMHSVYDGTKAAFLNAITQFLTALAKGENNNNKAAITTAGYDFMLCYFHHFEWEVNHRFLMAIAHKNVLMKKDLRYVNPLLAGELEDRLVWFNRKLGEIC